MSLLSDDCSNTKGMLERKSRDNPDIAAPREEAPSKNTNIFFLGDCLLKDVVPCDTETQVEVTPNWKLEEITKALKDKQELSAQTAMHCLGGNQ